MYLMGNYSGYSDHLFILFYLSLLNVNLVILIVSGVTLAMHYTGNTVLAFESVEHIMHGIKA